VAKVPVEKMKSFEEEFLTYMDLKHRDVLDALRAGQFSDELTNVLESVAKDLTSKYN
jgi:F-type H+-transporting ATPase subunit alpha